MDDDFDDFVAAVPATAGKHQAYHAARHSLIT
jgi:hypothetical protein